MGQSKTNSTTKESTKNKISKFISAVSSKKYAEANKYLRNAVEDKILTKIDNAADKPIF